MPYTQLSFEHITSLRFEEEATAAGKAWRISKYFPNVAIGDCACVSFHTPPNMRSLYSYADIGKTGGQVRITLVEECTVSGGTPLTPWNLNRNYKDSVCHLTDVLFSPTISGGTELPSRYIGGDTQGNQIPGGTAYGGFIYLAPDTTYAIKAKAENAETDINMVFTLGVNI